MGNWIKDRVESAAKEYQTWPESFKKAFRLSTIVDRVPPSLRESIALLAEVDRLTTANADLQQRLDAAEVALRVAQGEVEGHKETIGAWIHSFNLSEAKVVELEAEKDAALQSISGEEVWRYWYRQFADMKHERDNSASALTAANSRVERLREALGRIAYKSGDSLSADRPFEIAQKALADDAKEGM